MRFDNPKLCSLPDCRYARLVLVHSIKNLLLPVILSAEIAMEGDSLTDKQRRHLQTVIDKGLQARDLATEILGGTSADFFHPQK